MQRNKFIIIALVLLSLIAYKAYGNIHVIEIPNIARKLSPIPPAIAWQESPFVTGQFEVAKVFGRSTGCSSADADFIRFVNDTAVKAGVDSRIVAATIAIESGCNPLAISKSAGALGLMQIMVPIWKKDFDFSNTNLLNPRDNIRVGTKILSDLIYNYGVTGGIRRYNGLGVNCESCDPGYTYKIMSLAGVK